MNNFIIRPEYLKAVKPFINKDIIKILTGQRRTGKSYLMYQIIDLIKKEYRSCNIIYINKELHEFDSINNYKELYEFVKSKSQKNKTNYLFIDEIQNIDSFEHALKSFYAEGSYDIYCTGSNANLLSGELATLLSGRYIEIKVNPLSYTEFLQFHNLDNNSQSIDLYLKYGGLPYLKNLQLTDDVVFEYLKNIYEAILFKDVIARFKPRNIDLLERLILFLAKQTGTIFSARSIVKFLKSQNINVSVNSLLDYIKFLSSAFIISKVSRTDIQGKRVFEVGEKYYFTDVGIRNAIAGFSPFDLGLIIENAVHNYLLHYGYNIRVGQSGQKEIDFIAEKGGERIYIQVALRITDITTANREFGNLLNIKDNYPKYVITLDEYSGTSHEGIQHIPLRKFLSEFK